MAIVLFFPLIIEDTLFADFPDRLPILYMITTLLSFSPVYFAAMLVRLPHKLLVNSSSLEKMCVAAMKGFRKVCAMNMYHKSLLLNMTAQLRAGISPVGIQFLVI